MKIKSFKVYTDEGAFVGNDLCTVLEILENNGYIVNKRNCRRTVAPLCYNG